MSRVRVRVIRLLGLGLGLGLGFQVGVRIRVKVKGIHVCVRSNAVPVLPQYECLEIGSGILHVSFALLSFAQGLGLA